MLKEEQKKGGREVFGEAIFLDKLSSLGVLAQVERQF